MKRLWMAVAMLAVAFLTGSEKAGAQEPRAGDSAAGLSAGTESPRAKAEIKTVKKDEHQFWDRTNAWLFAGVGAARTLDYFSTLNMRRRGRQEILLTNDAVDNHAAFVAIEAAGTGVSMGASYLFHRYGHHKLERWVSAVHIGLAAVGAARNYSLKTAHRAPANTVLGGIAR